MSQRGILQDLAQWGAANRDSHGRDDLIRRAHAAGITKNKIHTLTGVSRPTIDKILKEPPMQTQTVDTITPATTTWEMCDHWHPTLGLPLAEPALCPRLGDVIAVQINGRTTGAVITREHKARIPGTTAHALDHPNLSYGFATTQANKDLIILSPTWMRNEKVDHVQAGPMRTVCRSPLTIRQAYVNREDGSIHWDRVFRPIDAPDPDKVCPKCAEEVARDAHHATHRFAVPESAMYLSASTSGGDWDATGEWERDTTRGISDQMVDKINTLLQEAAVLEYVEELPRPEDWVEGQEYDELEVRGVDDSLLSTFVIPNEEAWEWWAHRLGLRKIADS